MSEFRKILNETITDLQGICISGDIEFDTCIEAMKRFAKKYNVVLNVQADKDGFVDCPYCEMKHRHGGNGNGTAEGHRIPDCGNEIGYNVISFKE